MSVNELLIENGTKDWNPRLGSAYLSFSRRRCKLDSCPIAILAEGPKVCRADFDYGKRKEVIALPAPGLLGPQARPSFFRRFRYLER